MQFMRIFYSKNVIRVLSFPKHLIGKNIWETFFLSECGIQKYFLSVLNAEFEYFFNIISKQAFSIKSCLNRQDKYG